MNLSIQQFFRRHAPPPAECEQRQIPQSDAGAQPSQPPSPASLPPQCLQPIDQQLIDRALILAEKLRDYVTAYQCGLSWYNRTGNPEAKQVANTAKVKLVELLGTAFGFED